MKILYICDSDPKPASGVAVKIASQVAAWQKMGIEVDLLSYESLRLFDLHMQPKSTPFSFSLPAGRAWFFQRQIVASYRLMRMTRNMDYDFCYCRYLLFMPFLPVALKRAARRLVFEINSDEDKEWRVTNRLLWAYNKLGRRAVLPLADGLVCVTPELASSYDSWHKSTATIANGISCADYPFVEDTGNKTPQVYFVCSSEQRWQGLDKITHLAGLMPNIIFHVIGVHRRNKSNLVFHGRPPEFEVTELLKGADLAFSTLALHRKNLDQACPLKSRQYLAMGIPMVYAYVDPDLPADAPFALRIENTEDNYVKEMDSISTFIDRVFKNTAMRRKARCHTEENLDAGIKEKQRLGFLRELG
ncbi:glycosyltransferase [Dethiosulfatarculus sandiegensis]|uniref:glycosyltransferase n=1 Tax=Dethiosulfatarculus sandiegensis TaxID=1429043 RepID=UPI0018D0740F|nr:glycosyltransferase [Dethiosulfatarculus sandiegensis]